MEWDESFVEQLKRGEAAAFEVLVERFERPLYRFFFCHSRDHHAAEELTAETFAQLVHSIRQIRGGCEQLRAYVFATARHVQQRRWRERKKKALPLDEASAIGDPRASPDDAIAQREEREQLLDAIGQLAEQERSVVLLRYVEQLPIDEIAAALEMPAGTVKSHLHRSKEKLKRLLTAKEEHERSQ
jgi:RNA polymerase sigma-70 factor, ECF subfamily